MLLQNFFFRLIAPTKKISALKIKNGAGICCDLFCKNKAPPKENCAGVFFMRGFCHLQNRYIIGS